MPNQEISTESLMMSTVFTNHSGRRAWRCESPHLSGLNLYFETAEQGKAFSNWYHLREPVNGEAPGMIYSRLNNPNLEISKSAFVCGMKLR